MSPYCFNLGSASKDFANYEVSEVSLNGTDYDVSQRNKFFSIDFGWICWINTANIYYDLMKKLNIKYKIILRFSKSVCVI